MIQFYCNPDLKIIKVRLLTDSM